MQSFRNFIESDIKNDKKEYIIWRIYEEFLRMDKKKGLQEQRRLL